MPVHINLIDDSHHHPALEVRVAQGTRRAGRRVRAALRAAVLDPIVGTAGYGIGIVKRYATAADEFVYFSPYAIAVGGGLALYQNDHELLGVALSVAGGLAGLHRAIRQ